MEQAAQAILVRSQENRGAVITEEHLAELPEPVRRYLTFAHVVGKEPIRTVRLKQRGAIALGKGATWRALTAEQYFTTNPAAFLWHGVLHPLPFLSVSATDMYAEGHGLMRIKAMSCIPLGTARGPGVDQGELLRYLGETAWFPTALLADSIHWDAIDDQQAKATITLPGISASAIFHVDEWGRYTHLTAERYRKEHNRQVLRPWIGRWDDYREIHGFRIPMKAEAAYVRESGECSYFRSEVTTIEYDQSAPY